jgi:hypothetical protein
VNEAVGARILTNIRRDPTLVGRIVDEMFLSNTDAGSGIMLMAGIVSRHPEIAGAYASSMWGQLSETERSVWGLIADAMTERYLVAGVPGRAD